MAVFGLVLILAGITLVYLSMDKAAEASISANAQLRELHALVGENAEAQQAVARVLDDFKEDGTTGVALPFELRQAGADEAAVAQAAAMQAAVDALEYRKSLVDVGAPFGGWIVAAGLIIAFFGFWFWSSRVQRYEDAILRRQGEAADPNLVPQPLPWSQLWRRLRSLLGLRRDGSRPTD